MDVGIKCLRKCERIEEQFVLDFHVKLPCYCFEELGEMEGVEHRCQVSPPLRL